MRGRVLLAKCGLVLGSGAVLAQLPPIPPAPPTYPSTGLPAIPQAPAPLSPLSPAGPLMPQPEVNTPRSTVQNPSANTPGSKGNPIAQPLQLPLPQPENRISINVNDLTLKRVAGAWQLWVGHRMLRDFGDRENDARDAHRVFRDLRPTEWVTIGGPQPVIEYGLVNGRPPVAAGPPGAEQPQGLSASVVGDRPLVSGTGAKAIIPIDLRTVRVEAVRGVWCLRDDNAIHANFGPNKTDAEQALAVVQRYGFNRVGIVGSPAPVMTYLFAAHDQAPVTKNAMTAAALQAQIDGLNRVGIPVPGVGFVGEMIRFDARKLEVRKLGSEWVVAAGSDILGRFGPTEWAAREAARTIADARFTEFCKLGSAGLTFFLVDGKAPTRVPFAVQGRRFDPSTLKVQNYGDRWAVTENGRHLIDCASADEGETLIRVIKAYGFDQLCHMGPTPRIGVSFFAKVK